MKKLTSVVLSSIFILTLQAQINIDTSPIIFIYDASGSMWGKMDGLTKMEIASNVLSETLDKLPQDQQIGLVAYGHRRKKDCEDVEFLIDMNNKNKDRIREALKKIKPLGRTPLAYSAQKVIEQLRNSKTKATIILVTDGIEVCEGNLCDVVRQAKESGIDFKLHVIGFGLKNTDIASLKCAAEQGQGKYHDAATAIDLSESLEEATSATIDSFKDEKPVQSEKNFSVFAIKNNEPIDALVKAFKAKTDTLVSSIRTYGDSSFLSLPPGKYDLKFELPNNKIEAIIAYDIESFKDSIGHKTMSFDTGEINIMTTNNGDGWDAVVTVYSKSTGKKVGGTRTYGKSTNIELNPGIYDIELVAMKLKGLNDYRIENVEIKGNEITNVSHGFESGTLNLLSTNNGEGWDSVVKIISKANDKNLAGGRTYGKTQSYLLSPGLYEVQFEAMKLRGIESKSDAKSFEIMVNDETNINHDFKSGIIKIGARKDGQLVDAVIKVIETKSGQNTDGGRTYTSTSSNPKEMILSPATYKIMVTDIKSGTIKEFSLVLKVGDSIEKFAEF